MDDFFDQEDLGDESYLCGQCNQKKPNQTKQTKLTNVGAFLIINLKRAQMNGMKIQTRVNYPKDGLGLSSYTQPSITDPFDLVAVILHEGLRTIEGHYTAICRDNNNRWWRFDDAKPAVEVPTTDQFSKGTGQEYVLFYRRRMAPATERTLRVTPLPALARCDIGTVLDYVNKCH
jgi:ubiquitin C-terminal hydrolase